MCGSAMKLASSTSAMELSKPTRINYCNSKNIVHVASGFGFSLFASKSKLFGGGVDIFSNQVHTDGFWPRGRRLMLGNSESCDCIVDVAAGRRHFLVATERGLYAFGDNAHGQCGHDPVTMPFLLPNEKCVHAVDVPSKTPIRQVHCTLDTSFVLLDSGEVFSFGLGTDGQLGRGVQASDWRCRPVEGDIKGVKVASLHGSTDTLLAVSESGELFMWGQNEYAQMNPFSEQMQEGFAREVRFAIPKIASASSTATSCIVVTVDGQVFVWGYGVLGQGPNITSLSRPTLLEASLFSGGPGDSGKVKRVFAGNTSMFAISEAENLFAWGVNRFSHLGLGHKNNQYFPYQVVLPKRPLQVSVAPDHTLFLLH
ncbi:Williams-Beuren syndrome chromosomal region 16 protein [Toxocara canis]|uniref:Williams-Beuren syndrome chromosomal region 16 protein n=1 Tax=Toxocara canis TaxID=6265 RepID=A0A0B2W651_TOXCA|nr:Williams-Beuren syndrome chromosomal region 16 protein [Toxocara canis]